MHRPALGRSEGDTPTKRYALAMPVITPSENGA